MAENQTKQLHYGLYSILTVMYNSSLPSKKFNEESPELVEYNVDPKISFRVDVENIIINLRVNAKIKETEEMVMEIETAFAYKVPSLKDYVTQTDIEGKKGWNFKDSKDSPLLTVLIGVSYSTMRGIIIERNRGTMLETVYLPVINPNVFLKSSENKQAE